MYIVYNVIVMPVVMESKNWLFEYKYVINLLSTYNLARLMPFFLLKILILFISIFFRVINEVLVSKTAWEINRS